MTAYEIRPFGAADWRRLRAMRLQMLADVPIAFVETLDTARARTVDEWRENAASSELPGRQGVAAVRSGDSEWLGMARFAVFPETPDRPFIYSVYVAPELRGTGLADELLNDVESWATEAGHTELYLHVHEDNAQARRFYLRRGYTETGERVPYPLDPSRAEVLMRLTR